MNKYVLFIHGAGEGAHEEDKLLAHSLEENLGPGYDVDCPAMPDEANAPYGPWKKKIGELLNLQQKPVILVGHSAGASYLVKILSEIKVAVPITGVFLLNTPFWGSEGWLYEGNEEVELPDDFNQRFPGEIRTFLYHTRDDEIVPFSHLALYAKLLPQAVVREIGTGGHQMNDDLSVVADDIKSLD